MSSIVEFVFAIPPRFFTAHYIKPAADIRPDNTFLASEGYQVDLTRLGLHLKALDYQEEHPEVDYPTALTFIQKERLLNFAEPSRHRVLEVHNRALKHQKENPGTDYLKAIKEVNGVYHGTKM